MFSIQSLNSQKDGCCFEVLVENASVGFLVRVGHQHEPLYCLAINQAVGFYNPTMPNGISQPITMSTAFKIITKVERMMKEFEESMSGVAS